MDDTTRCALQAIVRGLHRSEAIGDAAVMSIMAELQAAASAQRELGRGVGAQELMQLASDISQDTED